MGMEDRARHRILIVDDEPDLVELLETLLGLADYEIVTAVNGELALSAIRTHSPEAMVLDLNMPGLDGFGVLEALAHEPPEVRPKTLVLTARYAAGDVDRALALGASDYLAKPFSNKVLLGRVLNLLRDCAPRRRGPVAGV